MPRLIKTWEELAECKSETHYLEIEDASGWIHNKVENIDNWFRNNHYLSTHTFYGNQCEKSTKLLQKCGFDVEIANWDKLGW